MKKIKFASKTTLMIIMLGIFIFPTASFAGDYQVDGRTIHYEGLVPCGKSEPGPDESPEVTVSCQLCHLFVTIKGIVDFILLRIVSVIAVLILTAGGVMFVVSRGNPGDLTRAKSMMTAVVVGLVIIFASWLIINTIFMSIGLADWTGNLKEGWFEVSCSITLPAQ